MRTELRPRAAMMLALYRSCVTAMYLRILSVRSGTRTQVAIRERQRVSLRYWLTAEWARISATGNRWHLGSILVHRPIFHARQYSQRDAEGILQGYSLRAARAGIEDGRITEADFKGWEEERGHGFMQKWDSHYQALIETHDPEQNPQAGGLLLTRYGKGFYIYDAFALYRQLPAGVPGAYRLLANMVSLGKNPEWK